mgnify:CR=1 FL=1
MIKENSNLSDSWGIKKLGEVCSFQGGSQPAKSEFVYEKREGYVRFLQIRDFKSDKNITYIPESPKNRYCGDDDILLGRYGASVGKVLTNKTGAYNVAVMKTIPSKKFLFKRYLFFYFTSKDFQNRLEVVSSRSAQNGFSKSDIFDFPILVPPLPQQKQIVATLDKAFAAIDTAKANAEQNLKNAKELFESYLQNVFENKGDNWVSSELNEFVNFIDYRGRTPVKTSSGVRLITAKNIKLGYLQIKPEEFIAEDNYEAWMTRGIPNFGDVIFTTEAPLGHIAQVNTKEKLAFAQRVIVMQPDAKKINQTFLKYLLLSNPIRNKILARGTGATVLGIKSRLLKKIEIDFPNSIEEQEKIVIKLDTLSEETKKIEAIYTQKIADLEEMKKSVLQKAFSGQLNTVT